ncbi:MAG TPA: GTP-binding protein [Euryarchaeota archaeon]|nr:tRNA modification GTPase TrmE [archaeon BMS3Bbin15]HDL15753.1 GTP-binding protein [Euryarchaeota archaeon]
MLGSFKNVLRRILRVFNKRKVIQLGFYGPVNAGKTTLANKIAKDWLGKEVGDVSEIPHETRQVQKIENVEVSTGSGKLSMNIVDMPGIATQVDYKRFKVFGMNDEEAKTRAKEATKGVIEAIKWLDNVDAVLVVMDSTVDPYTQVNVTIIGNLEARGIPMIIVANKTDIKDSKPDAIESAFPQHLVVPISAATGKNLDELYKAIENYLT